MRSMILRSCITGSKFIGREGSSCKIGPRGDRCMREIGKSKKGRKNSRPVNANPSQSFERMLCAAQPIDSVITNAVAALIAFPTPGIHPVKSWETVRPTHGP